MLKVDVLDTIINSTKIWFTVDIYRYQSTDSNQSFVSLSVLYALFLKYLLIISPLYVYILNYLKYCDLSENMCCFVNVI